MAKPSSVLVVDDTLPRMAWDWAWWNWLIESNVDCDVFWNNSMFDSADMRMLTTASEQTWRLDIIIGHLLLFFDTTNIYYEYTHCRFGIPFEGESYWNQQNNKSIHNRHNNVVFPLVNNNPNL